MYWCNDNNDLGPKIRFMWQNNRVRLMVRFTTRNKFLQIKERL